MLSKEGEIRRDEACFDYSGKEVGNQLKYYSRKKKLFDVIVFTKSQVNLYSCHGGKGNQQWEYNHVEMRVYHVNHKK